MFDGKSVLVTGGTGSFGRRFIATMLERYRPRRVIVFSRDELKQFEMQGEPVYQHSAMRFFIGDVRDEARLNQAFHDVDFVVHAAALKQVPAAEYNPFESIKTNINGAQNVITAAIANRVARVVALSTDKACNPINLYGATKLASDKLFVAGNNMAGSSGGVFSVVRYGNVVGSRGSILPFFQGLIDKGATRLPITDPRMTRFWLTLQEGVDFVIDAFHRMQGGEVFVPRIPSARVVDIAEAIAPGVEHEIIGIRPGEKLHESMVPRDDAHLTLRFQSHYVIRPTIEFYEPHRYERDGTGAIGTPVEPEFEYNSATNERFLSIEELRTLFGSLALGH